MQDHRLKAQSFYEPGNGLARLSVVAVDDKNFCVVGFFGAVGVGTSRRTSRKSR
ncbi:hypothetical protein AWB68_06034 [Caballeronia choica]|jgi:hypothetical protein|uniref:Uncharacterized protein n=1 Tax=Caballeronia choica TaxID=326476 RepID=A0A158KL34_9BURK|nr:hypothetical protein AWB68_06034 [Caballeronia choica]